MDGYAKRVARDLERWIADGLVNAANREAILARLGSGGRHWSAAGAAAILGAILLALALLSFIAANWSDMPRATRFGAILVTLWGCYGGAALCHARGQTALGHAIALLGAVVFGAGIILTAQTFNISAFRNTGILIWAIGALLTACLIPSRPVLILAALLGLCWAALEIGNPFGPDILWSYLAVWLVTAIAASRMRSLASWNLISAGLLAWLAATLWNVAGLSLGGPAAGLATGSLYALIAGAIALAGAAMRDRAIFGSGNLTNWAASLTVLAGWALQIPLETAGRAGPGVSSAADPGVGPILGLAGTGFLLPALAATVLILGLALWRRLRGALPMLAFTAISACAILGLGLPFLANAVSPEAMLPLRVALGAVIYLLAAGLILQGARAGRAYVGGLGVALFILQSLYVYTVLFGSLLDTALFFLVGGALLIALSVILTRWQKRMKPTPAPSAGDAS